MPKSFHETLFNPILTLLCRTKSRTKCLQKHRMKTLTHQLSTAKRINAPPSSILEDQDYCHPTEGQRIASLIPPVEGDGLWKCCNAHEQELIHWSGAHPFKYLTCLRCQHILCEKCCTTAVLSRIPWFSSESGISTSQIVEMPRSKDSLLFYGQVCPSCGLTHRAQVVRTVIDTHANDTVPTLSFNGTLCACGKLADETWVRFKIGPIYEYRRDPHNAFAALSLQRAESSVLMQVDDGERSAGSSATSLVLGASASASSVELGDDMQGKTRYRPSGLRMEKLPQGPDEEGFARARMDVDPFDGRPRTVSTNS